MQYSIRGANAKMATFLAVVAELSVCSRYESWRRHEWCHKYYSNCDLFNSLYYCI